MRRFILCLEVLCAIVLTGCCNAPRTKCLATGCVDLQTDSRNCGSCGNACAARQVCQGGRCVCPSPLNQCGADCVDTRSDPRNCGSCGRACAPNESCAAGSCVCASPSQVCGGVCINTSSDSNNCGGCGRRCPSGQTCSGGMCMSPTGPGGPGGPPVIPNPGVECGSRVCAAGEACLRNCDLNFEPVCRPAGSTCCQPWTGAGGPQVVICGPGERCVPSDGINLARCER